MDRASVQRARIGGVNKCYNVPRCGGECQIRLSWKPLRPGTAGKQNQLLHNWKKKKKKKLTGKPGKPSGPCSPTGPWSP